MGKIFAIFDWCIAAVGFMLAWTEWATVADTVFAAVIKAGILVLVWYRLYRLIRGGKMPGWHEIANLFRLSRGRAPKPEVSRQAARTEQPNLSEPASDGYQEKEDA
jgi:hypothetical protein